MRIFIPLGQGAKERDNWELKYMLRSLQTNYFGEVEVYVYGDPESRPDWLKNVFYEEIERYYPEGLEERYGVKRYENYFATAHKLKRFALSEDCPNRFVYMYDDQLLVQQINSFDHLEGVVVGRFKDRKGFGYSRHDETVKAAIELAHQDKHHNGLYVGATHLPRIFDKDKLCKTFRRFPLEKQLIPYDIYTLYFNLYYDEPSVLLMKENKLKASIHWDANPQDLSPVKMAEIDEAAKNHEWINYTDKGLMAVDSLLMRWIEQKFPTKSKYE